MRRIANFAFIALAGCGNPANEQPVDLKPGGYSIVASGESYIEVGPSATRGEKCLSSFDAKEFGRFPLLHATRRWAGCSDEVQPRQGSAISGQRYCKGASFRPDDQSVYTYTAIIDRSGDAFVIKGETKDKADGSGPETGPWQVTGRRIGDC